MPYAILLLAYVAAVNGVVCCGLAMAASGRLCSAAMNWYSGYSGRKSVIGVAAFCLNT
jgi:hypothetical protein